MQTNKCLLLGVWRGLSLDLTWSLMLITMFVFYTKEVYLNIKGYNKAAFQFNNFECLYILGLRLHKEGRHPGLTFRTLFQRCNVEADGPSDNWCTKYDISHYLNRQSAAISKTFPLILYSNRQTNLHKLYYVSKNQTNKSHCNPLPLTQLIPRYF